MACKNYLISTFNVTIKYSLAGTMRLYLSINLATAFPMENMTMAP